MKIEFLTSVATDRLAYERGSVTDWKDDKDALRLIAAGYARPVESQAPQQQQQTNKTNR